MKSLSIISLAAVLLATAIFVFNFKIEKKPQTELAAQVETVDLTEPSKLEKPPLDAGPKPIGKFTVSESITEGDLQVFLINGADELHDKDYITLATAMEKNLVTVQETGSVNELSIDNNSDEYIFIHSGDIVKGGKQDRTVGYDVIIPPHAKNVPLQSFCVEQGRWRKRGGESVGKFGSTSNMLSSRELKLAAKYENNQGKVWKNVAEQQKKLNDNVSKMNGYNVDVTSDVSKSSLQLALESKELEKAKQVMEQKFKSLLDNNTTAVGFAYAINGEIYGIDIYNNKKLFTEMWTKIAESIIIESISQDDVEAYSEATPQDVVNFMEAVDAADASKKTEETKSINKATDLTTTENKDRNILFSTKDKEENKWIHKNYMKKDEETKQVAPSNQSLNIFNNRQVLDNE